MKIPIPAIAELTDANMHKDHTWRYKPELENSSGMQVGADSSHWTY
jgi:hypothetical protein